MADQVLAGPLAPAPSRRAPSRQGLRLGTRRHRRRCRRPVLDEDNPGLVRSLLSLMRGWNEHLWPSDLHRDDEQIAANTGEAEQAVRVLHKAVIKRDRILLEETARHRYWQGVVALVQSAGMI